MFNLILPVSKSLNYFLIKQFKKYYLKQKFNNIFALEGLMASIGQLPY